MSEKRRTYQIGDRSFYQDKLAMGQVEHLFKKLQKMGEFTLDTASLVEMVMKRYDILTIILVPSNLTRGALVEQLDAGPLTETEKFFRDELEWTQLVQIVSDFFDCNPVSVLSSAIAGVTKKLEGTLVMPARRTGSSSISPSPADGSATVPSSEETLTLNNPSAG